MDDEGRQVGLRAGVPEARELSFVALLELPAAGVAGEDLEGRAAAFQGTPDGPVEAALDRDVKADPTAHKTTTETRRTRRTA